VGSSKESIEYCLCANPRYLEGKCSACGLWIDNPKKLKKRNRHVTESDQTLPKECDCESPLVHFSGVCQKCFLMLPLPDDLPEPDPVSDQDLIKEITAKKAEIQRDIKVNFCPKCGVQVLNRSAYCHACGNKIPQTNQTFEASPSPVRKSSRKASPIPALIFLLLLIAGGIYLANGGHFAIGSSSFLYGTDDDGGSSGSCDLVSQALEFHDPRAFRMATSEEATQYKSLMAQAATEFRNEGESYYAEVASRMSRGQRGIDEYGNFPVLDYCGL